MYKIFINKYTTEIEFKFISNIQVKLISDNYIKYFS